MPANKSNYSISILGAGSVGLATAATLGEAGANVTVLARGKAVPQLRTEGIRVTGVLGEHVIKSGDFAVVDVNDASLSACDLLMVTTKTYEVAPALKALLPKLKTKSILLLQNGWGTAQEAKEIAKGIPIFTGILMVGYERRSPSHVHIHAFGDNSRVGTLFDDDIKPIQPLFELPRRGFIPFDYEPDVERIVLTKLIYNMCLNPLGALRNMTYGELMTNEETLGIMCEIADEGIRVLKAARGFNRFENGEAYVRGELVPKWLSKVGAHRSSMLQDLEAGRKTEIDYLNGAVCAMGRQMGIATPHNDYVVEQIRAVESRKSRHVSGTTV